MKDRSRPAELRKEFQRFFRAMDFIASRFKEDGCGRKEEIRAYHEIYQILGYAWEILSLQCKHWDGYKRTGSGKDVCRICGTVRGGKESFILLPYFGLKRVGEKRRPNSKKIFSSKKKAQITKDTIVFHGATLDVDVHNAYRKRLGRTKTLINMAAERIVTLRERGVECTIDDHLINVELPCDPAVLKEPQYGGFPWELKKDHLKKFPVLFAFNKDHELLGLSILLEKPGRRRKRIKKRTGSAHNRLKPTNSGRPR